MASGPITNRRGKNEFFFFLKVQNHREWWLQPCNSKMLSPWKEHYDQPVAAAAKSLQSCPTLHNSMGCSLPGSSIHGIFQARVLEWGAIAFSNDQPRQHVKKQRCYFANKDPSSQSYGLFSSHIWMWELNYKESWAEELMHLNCGVGEDSWESLGLQGDPTSPP